MLQFISLFILPLILFSCSSSLLQQKNSSLKPIAQTSQGVNDGVYTLDAKKYQLDNGLRVILAKNSKIPAFSLHIFYGVGSKHEVAGITGSSHYLEHMMFKGAKKYGLGAFDKLIEGNGGVSNAYTSNDMTVYYENLPKEALALTLDMESDRMQNLLLEGDEFNAEKNVVLEERKMRYENSPMGQLYQRSFSMLYAGTPYEVPVIGSVEDVKGVTREQVYAYFKTFYAPNNAVLVLSGDFEEETALALLQKSFGSIPESKEVGEKKLEKESSKLYESTFKVSLVELINGQSEKPIFMWGVLGYEVGKRESYVADLLSRLLAEGESSFFEQKYVKSPKAIMSKVFSANYNLQHKGLFLVGGEFFEEQDFEKFKKSLRKDIQTFCETQLTEENLAKSKNHMLLQTYSELDTNQGIANFLGSMELMRNDFTLYKDEFKAYDTVTVDELKKECFSILTRPDYLLGIWNKFDLKISI